MAPRIGILAALLGVSLLAGPSIAGVVRTLDGKTHEGTITLENGAIVIAAPGATARVDPANLLSADLRSAAATRPAAPKWTSRDLGEVRASGSARFTGTTAIVQGSGNLGTNRDSFHFVYQSLDGDGQILVRVASLARSDPLAKAGLMVRPSLEPTSSCASIFAHADERPCFLFRTRGGANAELSAGPRLSIPVYLRLVRQRDRFSGYASSDGQDWEEIGFANVAMPQKVLIGLFVASRQPNSLTTATFERVNVLGSGATASTAGELLQGVVLRNGSMIAGTVRSADESTVRLWRGVELSFPLAEVSRVVYSPLNDSLQEMLREARPGVLLLTGDFLEGRFRGIADQRVRISSVLFGLKAAPAAQVAAVQLAPASAGNGKYEIRAVDGSVLFADELGIENGRLVFTMAGTGKVSLHVTDLLELRAGPSRFAALNKLKPALAGAALHGRGLYVDELPGGLSLGSRLRSGLALEAGITAAYDLKGEYRVLTAHAAIAEGSLPTTGLRLVVLGDGRELYRSPPLSSLEDATTLAVPVTGVKKLEIKVEAAAPAALAPLLVLSEAALIR